jgi:phage-related protein
MKQRVPRIITIYKNYFWDFYNAQTQKTQKKIDWVIDLVKTLETIPQQYFDTIGEGIFEIRIEFQSNIFRVFCCFDEGNMVILMNGFQKKSPKTPKNEIEKAKSIMAEYFEEKEIKKLKK